VPPRPAPFVPIEEKFRRDIRDWAQANGIPLIRFAPVTARPM
jgi:hypothetical protein